MTNDTKTWNRLLVPCLLILAALWLVPLASADPGKGKASDHQTQGTAGTSGDPTKPQPKSGADDNGTGANQPGPYDSTRDGSASENGKGDGEANGKPCAGCVGKADNKNPPGQAPNGSDPNAGYECDRNQGVGQTNPAHTGCKDTPPPGCVKDCTPPPPGCQKDCTPPPPGCVKDCTPPPPGCQKDCTPPPPGCQKDCTPPPPGCKVNCTPPPPGCKVNCTPKKDVCQNIKGTQTKVPAGMTRDAKGRCVKPRPKDVCKNINGVQTKVPKGTRMVGGKCVNVGIRVKRASECKALLRIEVKARAGTVVTVRGAGVSLTRRVGPKGTLVITVSPREGGIVVVKSGSKTKRVGVSCGTQGTQLTG